MKRILFIALALCLTAASIQAQQKWTLEECIDYAVKNNITIKSNELTNESQQIRLEQSKNQILPDLSGSLSYGLTFGTTYDSDYHRHTTTSGNSNIGLNSGMILYNGSRIRNSIKAQYFSTLATKEDIKKAKESLSVNVATAFLQVLYNKELYALAEDQVKISQNQLDRSISLAEYGKIPEGQVSEARAQLSKDQYSALESKTTLQVSLLDLAQMLELKDWSNFDVSIPIIDVNTTSLKIGNAEDIYNYAVSTKSDVKASEYRLKSSEKELDVSKSGYYPSISLGANYSSRYFSDPFKFNNLGTQLRDNGGASLGINMSIPIFNKFDTKNNIRLSKIEIEKAKLNVESIQKTLYKEIQQAWFNASKALERFKSAEEGLKNMEVAYRFAEEKYNNGKATIYDFNTAKMNLATSKSNQLQAKYNMLFCIKLLEFYKSEPLKF